MVTGILSRTPTTAKNSQHCLLEYPYRFQYDTGRMGELVGWLVIEEKEDYDSWAVSLHLTTSLHMIPD